jgi:glycosyltransferase involved in cell wall biosynthesis
MEDRIVLVRPEPDGVIAPLSPGEREEAKSSFAGGKEYFLAVMTGARLEGVLNLLRAFSLFKKRQLSNMQLVIVLRDRISGKDAKEKLTTYKYREDLHWVDLWQEGMRASQQDELRKMTGGAYALLFPFAGDGLGVPIVNAWKAWVPVIAGPGGNNREIGGEAVLYGDPGNLAELAGQMMLIYKDEVRRNGLIEKGRDRLYSFQEDRPGTAVWKAIQKIN